MAFPEKLYTYSQLSLKVKLHWIARLIFFSKFESSIYWKKSLQIPNSLHGHGYNKKHGSDSTYIISQMEDLPLQFWIKNFLDMLKKIIIYAWKVASQWYNSISPVSGSFFHTV